jgi:hypothetical protein
MEDRERKIYSPVKELERMSSYCPLYLGDASWMRRAIIFPRIPEACAEKLADRAHRRSNSVISLRHLRH